MASERRFFPIIPNRTWWDLRRAFGRSLPGEVNPRYLATVLDISERAAANLMPNLRRVGLIDDVGAPTDRAVIWRDDAHYADVCGAIFSEVYPKQLTDAAPPPDPDRERVASWFARETRTGAAASTQMARLYLLLAQADSSAGDQLEEAGQRTARAEALPRAAKPKASSTPKPASAIMPPNAVKAEPTVHIDIQVHIDASATLDQIDQIFASMAKHLYGRA